MQKFINRLLLILLFATGVSAVSVTPALAIGYCNPQNISSGNNSVALSTISDIDLATMLSLTNSYSLTTSSNFSGYQLVCYLSGETLQYRNGIEGGYTVKFTSGDVDTYIKFTASLSDNNKYFDSGLISTSYSASDFDTEITLTAELVTGSDYDVASTSGSAEIPLLYLTSSSYSKTYSTASALRSQVSTRAAAAAASTYDLKGFASVNILFSPVSTTCVIENQEFTLPSTTLFAIQSGDTSDTQFTIPVTCSGSLNSLATKTFNLRAYSGDIVDATRYIIRNASSTSSGIGFQLFNDMADPLVFSASYDSSSTSLASMTQGTDLITSLTSLNIGARYKIYDSSSATPGTVVGTIMIYMEYD